MVDITGRDGIPTFAVNDRNRMSTVGDDADIKRCIYLIIKYRARRASDAPRFSRCEIHSLIFWLQRPDSRPRRTLCAPGARTLGTAHHIKTGRR